MDKASAYGAEDWGFESLRICFLFCPQLGFCFFIRDLKGCYCEKKFGQLIRVKKGMDIASKFSRDQATLSFTLFT